MSARIQCWLFFAVALFYDVIDCISSSTSSPPKEIRLSTTAPNATPPWLVDALKDIAYYLRAHKFNEYDRRYELQPQIAHREYYAAFPRPPLRSLHWEVHKHCEPSLIDCVDYLRKRLRSVGMKRGDDTAVVIQEQQWDLNNNSKQIEIVDEECRKMKAIDDVQANNFEGPIERFQWRTTASYFMCWYTMQSDPHLEHISDGCDNFANCLDADTGPRNGDWRADDSVVFNCARYSFCPDVCCPIKHLTQRENCWNSADNPCFAGNPAGQRECTVHRDQNADLRDMILNRWNVSCSCPRKGFEWNSLYGICVDVDECALGSHNCDGEGEVCVNLPGSFKCVCKWGHVHDNKSGRCLKSPALERFMLQKRENETHGKSASIWTNLLTVFSHSAAVSSLSDWRLIVFFPLIVCLE